MAAPVLVVTHMHSPQVEEGVSALIEACKDGHTTTARVLIEHGAVIDCQSEVKSMIH